MELWPIFDGFFLEHRSIKEHTQLLDLRTNLTWAKKKLFVVYKKIRYRIIYREERSDHSKS